MSRIEGVDELNNTLRDIGNTNAEAVIRKWTEYVRGEAVDLCPVRTGELRQSIHCDTERQGDEVIGVVYTNKEYAPYVELGTSKQEPQPYLYPALNNNLLYVTKGIKKDLRAVMNK